jgi:hypothetical protein
MRVFEELAWYFGNRVGHGDWDISDIYPVRIALFTKRPVGSVDD